MKKLYPIIVLVVLAVIGVNLTFYFSFKQNVIDYHKDVIAEQVKLCGSQIENTVLTYQNDLQQLLKRNARRIPEIFDNPDAFRGFSSDLQDLYSKNRELISNISVLDNRNSYLGIYLKDNYELVIDTFPRQVNNDLESKKSIIRQKGYYISCLPYYKNTRLAGNLVVEINLEKYLNTIFPYFSVQGLRWQWLANSNDQSMMSNFPDSITVKDLEKISSAIPSGIPFIIEHNYTDVPGSTRSVLSFVYPLKVLNNDLAMVFTYEPGQLKSNFLRNNLILLMFSLLVMILLIVFILYRTKLERLRHEKKSAELLSLKMIVEHFPVGIMITDSTGIIKNINRTGQKMLFLEKDEDITGSNISSQFLISNKYLLKDQVSTFFDSNHFIHYEKDGNEIVIYRKDIKEQIAGEELIISALIDVSPLEKSRKQEAAANTAKSDFLATMSHEIRTPMNGIIGMTDNLLKGNLSIDQKEQVKIIKRSSDLLLNIINDILDFSKIEAGKMMLEEIPFNLTEEISFSVELFKSLADEKGLELLTNIHPSVPDYLIGDPLRLRQVICNLISNAIKFTQEGKITVGVNLIERNNSSLNILFYVEDTGIGIAKENLKKIFGSYEQGKNSVSRKFGGTGLGMAISKQLVELMNGDIWVESPCSALKDDKYPGTKFSFTVELHSNERVKKSYDFSNIRQYQQISALILTKTKEINNDLPGMLDKFGINYIVRTFEGSSIESTIFNLVQKRDLFQLIIIVDKPEYEGFSIAQQLKESKLAELYPIIMFSSNDQPGNHVRSKALGIDYYLIQPFESNEVYNIIRENFPGLSDHGGVTPLVNKIRTKLEILIAEDNIINQRVIQSIFKHLGYEIDIARNGHEAVEKVSSKDYDIIFMDILMPEMDGVAATNEIRKKNLKMPIIALTASDEAERKTEAFAAGMNDFIGKPVKLETIKQILIKWFSEGI